MELSFIICGDTRESTSSSPHSLLIKTDESGNVSGLDSPGSSVQFRCYPNPAQDYIRILTNTPDPITEISITTLTGVCLRKQLTNQNIMVNDLTAGLYILAIKTNIGMAYVKFVKE